jgi:hypothetical protein
MITTFRRILLTVFSVSRCLWGELVFSRLHCQFATPFVHLVKFCFAPVKSGRRVIPWATNTSQNFPG